ncbi:MAG: radical SAM protein [Deltaproteobacteria bacterium]|nr:radical SAM protein [Deltaproteobacteria bacterium]
MRQPKFTFINLPLPDAEQAGSLKDIANVLPPLGIGYIAAVLEQNKFTVSIIDARATELSLSQVEEIVSSSWPDIIGVTATVLDINRALEFGTAIKKRFAHTILLLGGPHLTSLPKETLEQSCYDIGVIGEGEFTMLELAQAWTQAADQNDFWLRLKSIGGLVFKHNGEIIATPGRGYIQDLDALPFPARHLYPPLSTYRPVPGSYMQLPMAHVISSRGCPYQCIYCDRSIFGQKFRSRSPKNVVDEIEELVKLHHAKEIKFFDDTFTLDKKRVYGIIDELKARNLKIKWSCLTRVNCVDLPLLTAMKESGCWQLLYGLESGDQRMLNIMKKGSTVEQNRNAVFWAKQVGMRVRAFFVLGMPGESKESLQTTVEFAKSLPLDFVNFYSVTLYPGNELYDMAKQEGKLRHSDFAHYNPLIDVHKTQLAYVPDEFSEEELKRLVAKAHKQFYLRPTYIARQICTVRSLSDVLGYWRGFKAIVNL